MPHKFKIGDKVLISNDFYIGKNPKLAPTYTGPGEIIDINDTNAKVKLNNKIKILNMNELKLFLQEHQSDQDQTFLTTILMTLLVINLLLALALN